MKEVYEPVEIEVIEIDQAEIVTVSTCPPDNETELGA